MAHKWQSGPIDLGYGSVDRARRATYIQKFSNESFQNCVNTVQKQK